MACLLVVLNAITSLLMVLEDWASFFSGLGGQGQFVGGLGGQDQFVGGLGAQDQFVDGLGGQDQFVSGAGLIGRIKCLVFQTFENHKLTKFWRTHLKHFFLGFLHEHIADTKGYPSIGNYQYLFYLFIQLEFYGTLG